MDPHDLKAGDSCPACGGTLKPVPVPTPEQFAAAFNHENPGALPARADTANPAQRADLGALFRCDACPYATRFKTSAAA